MVSNTFFKSMIAGVSTLEKEWRNKVLLDESLPPLLSCVLWAGETRDVVQVADKVSPISSKIYLKGLKTKGTLC